MTLAPYAVDGGAASAVDGGTPDMEENLASAPAVAALQPPGAVHAQARLVGAGAVVDPAVDHAAVVAGLVPGHFDFLLQHSDAQPREALGQLERGGQADDTATDDGKIAVVGGAHVRRDLAIRPAPIPDDRSNGPRTMR